MRKRGMPSPDRADAVAMALVEFEQVVDVAAHEQGRLITYGVEVYNGSPKARVHVSDPDDLSSVALSLSWVQTEVIESQWAAWPLCQGHSHPLELALVDDDIVWTCPATGASRARFGDLARGRG